MTKEVKLKDKVFCTKRNLNAIVEEYKGGLFTLAFENGTYGRYKPEVLNGHRFVLHIEKKTTKENVPTNVIYVDFFNKRVG